MAADSKSSLRSTRHAPSAPPRPTLAIPSATDNKPAPATRLGKRLRPLLEPQEESRAIKLQKPDHQPVLQPRNSARGYLKDEEATAKGPHGRVVAPLPRLRVASAVQPRPNGNITNSTASPIRHVNGESQTDDSLQLHPTNGTTSRESERRTLRSRDGGSRSKSELSLYFPNYEDLISIEIKENEPLEADTRLFVTEDPPKSPTATQCFVLASPTLSSPSKPLTPPTLPSLRPPSSPTAFQTLDLCDHTPSPHFTSTDPLSDALFAKAHHRAERQEKQLRNIEKERAQHEKVQLERLLEGLQGPDWLRVMGISGVVEGERKRWEDKRAWFIREVRALIEKFRLWKEEERRRKMEKDTSTRGDDEEESEEENVDEEDEDEEEEDDDDEPDELNPATSNGTNYTDVDALAALQLHNETLSASGPTPGPRRQRRPTVSGFEMPPAPPPVEQPFVSFFSKPHQRAAALEKHRRTGRTRFAFGHPVPDMEQRDFRLPGEFITPQSLKASARSRRLQRRNVKST